MNLLKKKMLLSPILAVALAFLLAGSVSFLPQNTPSSQPSPQPTSFPGSTMPPLPSTAPVAQSALNGNIIPILFAVAAIFVGAVIAFLLFSEKSLKKEITE
jgi:hypothetical protein